MIVASFWRVWTTIAKDQWVQKTGRWTMENRSQKRKCLQNFYTATRPLSQWCRINWGPFSPVFLVTKAGASWPVSVWRNGMCSYTSGGSRWSPCRQLQVQFSRRTSWNHSTGQLILLFTDQCRTPEACKICGGQRSLPVVCLLQNWHSPRNLFEDLVGSGGTLGQVAHEGVSIFLL